MSKITAKTRTRKESLGPAERERGMRLREKEGAGLAGEGLAGEGLIEVTTLGL